MDERNSFEGFSPTAYGAPVQPVLAVETPPAISPLRPLSTGEILDRTFALYRQRFWLFTGIGMLPAVVLTATTAARMVYMAATHRVDTVTTGADPAAIQRALSTLAQTQVYFLPATVLFLLAYGLSHAATVHAVGRLTRGLESTAAEAYQATRGHWLRWSGIALRWFWSVLWPTLPIAIVLLFAAPFARGNAIFIGTIMVLGVLLLPAAIVFGVINLLRNSLSMAAGVEEDLGVNAAMRRSKVLAAGRKGRIFLSLLLVYALQTVAGALQLPFVWFAVTTRGAEHAVLQGTQLLISFVVTALVTPIASIALTMLYLDERVRREGYDIELMMQQTFRSSPSLAPVSPSTGTYEA